uniref:m7GpppX diphosphatase n=1 Tax=Polytomella parva TaxID=51329 RepID=A0A7S0YF63_9CHLO|mmetsp:Transcript_2336/g.3536  ORF Transcript_2336/g.3536 Transcript_2336/m.3536 type:complete len:311 (+) Transcript_2336:89-1021(+)|eukprot:CAMPEP_0175058498 /NCGR_PEP_ID=MMETSP0052_2-20121109/11879_1 /TAXON_ID=51329 ORGANISM="Polytomella parva, Strain SAG 63-3" /NCGR_SAMPLE_ID=MMETSP0052_2 /ASSEMBLY_ACC=CAM_ASM_000194 /LENGTH=310 /DNA_ID=CAMNT_0016323881 /DNA_START=65 /DNA_END=997 /DNA_ORIENTATION=+
MSEISSKELASTGKLPNLSQFKFEKVLMEFSDTKGLVVSGTFEPFEEKAILILNRKMFDTKNIEGLFCEEACLELDFVNNIYSKYNSTVPPTHGKITVDIIYPATEKHFQKYKIQPRFLVQETPELYKDKVESYIKLNPEAHIQWVFNILDKKAETERILFEDSDPESGFVLLPDFKWDQSQLNQLYCLAIIHRRGIASIRDLNASHLDMLESILSKSKEAIKERFGVSQSSIRAYVHYPPSYYHFHVHFVHEQMQGATALVGKAILLEDIIDMIKTFGSDALQKRTLNYFIGKEDPLWRRVGVEETPEV